MDGNPIRTIRFRQLVNPLVVGAADLILSWPPRSGLLHIIAISDRIGLARMKQALLALTVISCFLVIGCGEKEEVNPQVENNPTPELIEKARVAGGDGAPAGGGTPSSSVN